MNEHFEKVISGKICPYCECETKLVGGEVIFPHRTSENPKPPFLLKKYYVCIKNQDHYVGTYSDNLKSLGRLADPVLRNLRSEGHKVFDPLWKEQGVFKTQRKAYEWLSISMDIPFRYTHFGMFSVEQCNEAIRLVTETYGNILSG
jgi:hypothetical protein